MTFSMVGEYLGKSDNRTVETWFKNLDVFYERDGNGNYYVIQQEFLYIANRDAEKAFKEKYGENWKEVLNGSEEQNEEVQDATILRKRKYVPQTPEAQSFGEKWKDL